MTLIKTRFLIVLSTLQRSWAEWLEGLPVSPEALVSWRDPPLQRIREVFGRPKRRGLRRPMPRESKTQPIALNSALPW